jgi:hypothetical protein
MPDLVHFYRTDQADTNRKVEHGPLCYITIHQIAFTNYIDDLRIKRYNESGLFCYRQRYNYG